MLSPSEYEKLLHDIKRMAKVIKIVIEEPDAEARKYLGSLLCDEADRLAKDVDEMKEQT